MNDSAWILTNVRKFPPTEARKVRYYHTDGMRQYSSYNEVEEPGSNERLTQTWVHFPSGWKVERKYEMIEGSWKVVDSSVFGSDGHQIPISPALEAAALQELGWHGEPK